MEELLKNNLKCNFIKKYQQEKDNISILCKRTHRISNLQRKILKQFVSKNIIVGFYYVGIIIRYILTKVLSLVEIFSKEMLLGKKYDCYCKKKFSASSRHVRILHASGSAKLRRHTNVAAEHTLPGARLTVMRSFKRRRRLDQLYSVITASLSIIEKNGSGLFDSF